MHPGVSYEVLENQRKTKVRRGELSGFKKSRGIEKPPEEQIKSEGFHVSNKKKLNKYNINIIQR